jgi:DNA-binding transcriptional LysR family regulator
MNLNEIAVFARVVELGSFTRAAEQLGVPKSSVSRAVARLEERLGVRLLARSTRALRLTDAGVAYHERVTAALGLIDDAEHEVSHLQGAPRGTLRITAPYDIGVGFLAEITARFTARHPDVRVESVLTGRTVDLIAEGFDLALRAGQLRDSSLIARKIGAMEGRLFAAPAYLAARGTPATPEDLGHHGCVLFRPQNGKARWPLEGPSGKVTVEVSGPIGADDLSFVRAATLAGGGIALLPWFLCAPDVAAGRLQRVLPAYEQTGVALYVVHPPGEHLPRRVAVFRDFLIQSLTPPPWRA